MTREMINVRRSGSFVRVDLKDKDHHVLALAPTNAVMMASTIKKLNPGEFDFDGIKMKLDVNRWVELSFSPCDAVFCLSPEAVVDLVYRLRSAGKSL